MKIDLDFWLNFSIWLLVEREGGRVSKIDLNETLSGNWGLDVLGRGGRYI